MSVGARLLVGGGQDIGHQFAEHLLARVGEVGGVLGFAGTVREPFVELGEDGPEPPFRRRGQFAPGATGSNRREAREGAGLMARPPRS